MLEAKWFLKSLQHRHETLLKVTRCIVKQQQAFFEHGPEYMQPLILQEIASLVGLHASTISRITSQKYMYTPRGLFELKFFFSSHIETLEGGQASAIATQAFIRKFIQQEIPTQPLSDDKLALLLQAQGLKVARRTVSKYRDIMAIPPSHERKVFI